MLNVGREDWQRQRVLDCFKAADRLPSTTQFLFFFSFDMSSVPGNSASDINVIKNYFAPLAKHPRMMKHPRGGTIVSTFAGENCTFGQGSMEAGWAYVKRELNAITPVRASIKYAEANPE